jgi:mono/diheme cytochrome c family protein
MKTFCAMLMCMVMAAGCGKKAKPQPPDQRQRLEIVRREIQAALGEKYDEPVPAASPAQLARGLELYPQLCAGCHGARGDGAGVESGGLLQHPSSFIDPAQATFFSEQARLHIIRKGIGGTAMVGWEEVLPESDIVAIYMYVRHLYQRANS